MNSLMKLRFLTQGMNYKVGIHTMGCPRNILYGRRPKVNTAAKALPVSAARPDVGPLWLCMGSSVIF